MHHRNAYDIVLVGQGLAGSLLGWQLARTNRRLLIIDSASRYSASRVAAGLINPVTGRRLVKTKQLDLLLPVAFECYRTLERRFHCTFLSRIQLLRLFQSADEIALLEKRMADPQYAPYLGRYYASGSKADYLNDPCGSLTLRQAAVLDIGLLLDKLRRFFIRQGQYLQHQLEYHHISLDSELIRLQCANLQLTTRRLIFCEGHRATGNPWFSWLPFKPAEGSILSLETAACLGERLLNAGKWLLPTGKTKSGFGYKLGATYDWELDRDNRAGARQELLSGLAKVLNPRTLHNTDVRILAQQTGVRPCTHDRQPYLGMHPRLPGLGIFNGFGSKGALLIPWFAAAFARHLLSGDALPEAGSIARVALHD